MKNEKIEQGTVIEIHNEEEREIFLNSIGCLTDRQIHRRMNIIVIIILLFSLFSLGTFICFPEVYIEAFKNTL